MIELTRGEKAQKPGGQRYTLTVGPERITIAAAGEAGLFYGTRTLMQLVQQGRDGPTVKGMKIADRPDIPYRVAHYDTKHHQDKAEYVRSFIRELADYKINVLLWEWSPRKAFQISSVASVAASGRYPPVMPLARQSRSGVTSSCPQANIRPVLPNPVFISSSIIIRPCSSQSFRTF